MYGCFTRMYMCSLPGAQRRSKQGVGSLGTGIIDGCDMPYGYEE